MTTFSKKICLLGDFAVGKTSLVRRFVYDLFDDRYISTIGVKVSRKTVMLPHAGEIVELHMMLWDLAGSEEFDVLRASYLRGTAGAVLVCDVTRPVTLEHLTRYVQDLHRISPEARLIVAGNKQDLVEQQRIALQDLQGVAAGLGAPCFLTSAKTGNEVETLFRQMGRLVLGQ